ncbi:Coiled-coil domain-containing protein 63 [Allomyces arbusculus]|nr:Coiled-coil domain-containing protein 63 [Allomyces arbusculus]
MSRAQSVTSGEANDGAVELEYNKLQRAFRLMESERKSYADEARLLIKKQRSAIEKMRRDNEYLLQELALMQRRMDDNRKNGSGSEKAEVLQQQAEFHQTRMRAAADAITQLDKDMEAVHLAMAEQRQKMGGVNAALVNSQAIDKQIRVLENRLDQALVKYNRALATNKRLRATIDNLRRERLVFDTVYTKFEKDLADQKKSMAEIIESSNSAYEARDEAQSKILLLTEKAEKEYQTYIQEVKELDRTLEQDRKLKNFLATKAADRLAESFNGADASRKPKKMSKTNSSSQDMLNASVASYEKVLSHIQEVTGVNSLDELVQRFKDVEDQNFSLFNYVNQMNNEVEKVAEELLRIQRQMESLAAENRQAERERKKKLGVVEHQLSETRSKTVSMQDRNTEIQTIVDQLYAGVQTLVAAFRASHVSVTSTAPAATDENGDAVTSPVPTAVVVSMTSSNGGSGSTAGISAPSTPAGNGPASGPLDAVPAVTVNPLQIPPLVLPAGSTTAEVLTAHLGAVEERVNDLLILHQLTINPRSKLASAGAAAAAAGGQGAGAGSVPGSAAPTLEDRDGAAAGAASAHLRGPVQVVVSIQAPNTGDNDTTDEENDDDRPLSRSELATKSIRGLTRRMQNGGSPKKRRGRKIKD